MNWQWKKGSLTVEAALVVPLTIVLMLPFLYIIRSLYIYDCVHTAVYETAEMMEVLLYLNSKLESEEEGASSAEEAQEELLAAITENLGGYKALSQVLSGISGESGAKALVQNAALQQLVRYFMDQLLQNMDLEAWGVQHGSNGISYGSSLFFYGEKEYSSLFRITVSYELDFPFARRFAKLAPVIITAVGRIYVGQDTVGDPSMTEEGEDVWYRIGSGNHYHTADCYLIAKRRITLSREEAIDQGYTACSACEADSRALVMVTEGGACYHAEGCRYIDPSIVQIRESDIETYGYLPCQICIGGGEWFQ